MKKVIEVYKMPDDAIEEVASAAERFLLKFYWGEMIIGQSLNWL